MIQRPFSILLSSDILCVGQKNEINIEDITGNETEYTYVLESTDKAALLYDGEKYYIVTFATGIITLIVTAAATLEYEETIQTIDLEIKDGLSEDFYIYFHNNWKNMGMNKYEDEKNIFTVEDITTSKFFISTSSTYPHHNLPILKTPSLSRYSNASFAIELTLKTSGSISFDYLAYTTSSSNKFTVSVQSNGGTKSEWFYDNSTNASSWQSKTKYLSKGTHIITFNYYKGSYSTGECSISNFKITGILPIYFLIQSNNQLYTFDSNNQLRQLATNNIKASTFVNEGFNTIPYSTQFTNSIKTLKEPKLLYWWNSSMELPQYKATIKGNPPLPQIISTKPCFKPSNANQIKNIEISPAYDGDNLYFTFLFDNSITEEIYFNGAWSEMQPGQRGMTAPQINSIPVSGWALKQNYNKITIKGTFEADPNSASSTSSDYINTILISYM